jgi:hypothetical protein
VQNAAFGPIRQPSRIVGAGYDQQLECVPLEPSGDGVDNVAVLTNIPAEPETSWHAELEDSEVVLNRGTDTVRLLTRRNGSVFSLRSSRMLRQDYGKERRSTQIHQLSVCQDGRAAEKRGYREPRRCLRDSANHFDI